MLERINKILNIIMGVVPGVFIGRVLYVYWEYLNHPEIYMVYSAPWYVYVLPEGILALLLILIAGIVKLIIRRKLK